MHVQPASSAIVCCPPACLQFAVSEELLLLEVARQATQQVKPGALPTVLRGSPGGPGSSPLLVTKGELGAGYWQQGLTSTASSTGRLPYQPVLRAAQLLYIEQRSSAVPVACAEEHGAQFPACAAC